MDRRACDQAQDGVVGGEEGRGVFQWLELEVPTPRAAPGPGAHSPAALAGCPAGGRVPSFPASPHKHGVGGSHGHPLSPFRPFQPMHHLARRLLACGCGFPRPSALGRLAGEGEMRGDEPYPEVFPQCPCLKTSFSGRDLGRDSAQPARGRARDLASSHRWLGLSAGESGE